MPVMLRISEDEWRRPERALRSTGRMRALHWSEAALEAFGALARHLEPHLGPAGFVSLPGSAALEVEDPGAAKVLRSLARGRIFGLVDIRRHGVPMQFGRRQALMVRGPEAERFDKDLGSRLRFDDYVPFTCVGGIVTPDPANSGLGYWFRDRCTDRDHFEGFDFFGGPVEGMTFPYPMNDALILDRRSGDLWWVRTST